MKTILSLIAVVLIIVLTACVKTIASEEEVSHEAFLHNKPFGASAQELLKSDKYTSLRVEVQYMRGFAPDREAINNLRKFLKKHLNKPDGINIVTREVAPINKKVLSRNEVINFEKENRLAYSSDKQIAVYILYTNGEFVDRKILGLAYRNTSAVIFGKNIKENSNKIGKPSRTKLETTVLLHEMGHLLGLVKDKELTNHDGAHNNHCSNRKCLMYYGIEVEDKFGHLIRKAVPELDDDCLQVLKANGGK